MKGLGVSQGIGIGKVYKLAAINTESQKRNKKNINDVNLEVERFEQAIDICRDQIKQLHDFTFDKIGKKEAEIFNVHLLILEDDQVYKDVIEGIKVKKCNAEYILTQQLKKYEEMFAGLEDKYLRDRLYDVQDVVNRTINILSGDGNRSIKDIVNNSILIARDLTPSDTAQLDISKVLGIIVEKGGSTSHAAILARTMEIPTIVGAEGIYDCVSNDDTIIINGTTGNIITNPNKLDLDVYNNRKEKENDFKNKLSLGKNEECVTLDGKKINVFANIGVPKDADSIIDNATGGIGLFRTEFLYMNSDRMPTEEEQFQAYKYVALKLKDGPVTIRTLDIGGDKELPYLNIEKEGNPVLGFRAIRYCLKNVDIFKVQLRAILRASKFGNIKIMFPMISEINELLKSKEILYECMDELRAKNINFDENIEIGIMIEVPSAAMIADILAEEVDFMSIGTNDLIQYTCAVDRENTKVLGLYQQFHPSIFRLLKFVVNAAHEANTRVCMCGEMASEPAAIRLLLGIGLDEYSVTSASTLLIRYIIRNSNAEKSKELVKGIEKFRDCESIEKYLRKDFEGDFGLYVER